MSDVRYYKISESIYNEYGIEEEPRFPGSVSFIRGQRIGGSLVKEPLEFYCSFTENNAPKHFHGYKIPVVSKTFVELLRKEGVDNYQLFEARLLSADRKSIWEGYYAFNVIGLVQCVDMDKSRYTTINAGGGGMPPLVEFSSIVVDVTRTQGMKLFRPVESPDVILVHEAIVKAMSDDKPDGGWGVSAKKLDTV